MLLAILALATAQSAPATSPPKPTAQAQFDAANAASEAGRWQDAATAFAAIEARLGPKGNARVLSIVRVRRVIALARLGRGGEAREPLTAGLATLPVEADLALDRLEALLALARIAEGENAYAVISAYVSEAEATTMSDRERLAVAVLGARATMFDPGDAALTYADRALALAIKPGAMSKERLGETRTLRARVLLNRGDHKEAYAELRKALAEQGGLSLKVTQGDIAVRSDLALAALLNKDNDSAKQYLAYTGAGLMKVAFDRGIAMDPPPCGGDADLRRDDVAVVQFGVLDDGTVAYASPIYSSRRLPNGAGRPSR